MLTPQESAQRISGLFVSGKQKVELEPEEVKSWHEISNLLIQMGFRHVHMSGSTSEMIKPYAIDATHRKNFAKMLSRFFKRLFSPHSEPQVNTQ